MDKLIDLFKIVPCVGTKYKFIVLLMNEVCQGYHTYSIINDILEKVKKDFFVCDYDILIDTILMESWSDPHSRFYCYGNFFPSFLKQRKTGWIPFDVPNCTNEQINKMFEYIDAVPKVKEALEQNSTINGGK